MALVYETTQYYVNELKKGKTMNEKKILIVDKDALDD